MARTTPHKTTHGRADRKVAHEAREPFAGLDPAELESLLTLRHHDPHSILGAHPVDGGVIVRCYRPDARRAFVLLKDNAPVEMKSRDGLFEAFVRDSRDTSHYRIEVHYPRGGVFALSDPYRFPPTVGELDLLLWNEGRHERPYDRLGAHVREVEGVRGVAFAVWAPNAAGVSVVGDFNSWDGRLHMMRMLGSSGVWELFIPDLGPGTPYKFELRGPDGPGQLKADPFAAQTEMPPATASIVHRANYRFGDDEWMSNRAGYDLLRGPISIYEVHLGSWRRVLEEGNRWLSYHEAAEQLAEYVCDMGFTHVELLPIAEHPFSGSWGYQVSGYYAPTRRFGDPDGFRYFVDYLHQRGIGVILDWVPAHFPRDSWSLGRFDGTALFEHLDPRQGEQPDWGTFVFNFSRNEVRNFLTAAADYLLDEYHVDGLRVDAVSSMLYLDYGRRDGEWIANRYGGRENLDAIAFLRTVNEQTYGRHAGIIMIAEESTAWGGVTRPTYAGGLGFGFKWDMGWMHDTLEYFEKDPIHRRYHHNNLTFGFLYAWSENFILPLSHDEVVHGKRSLLSKMPGDRWQQFANLRSLFGYMWSRPGKKTLFMGGEFGQWREWNYDQSLDWHLLKERDHRGLQLLVHDLNRLYRTQPALHEADCEPAGFRWIDANDADSNVISFLRISPSTGQRVVCIGNFSPLPRYDYRVGLPAPGYYRELINTDSATYGGGNVGNAGGVHAEDLPSHGLPYSASLVLPPLGYLIFEAPV